MHCERGGWPVLAFMLAALFIYRKQYSGEQKTLNIIYQQAPHELLQFVSPLNPVPSQLRYLQYVSRRNVVSEWPPLDRALTLDCVILRFIPNFDGEGGCCPIFRIYGQDPFLINDQSTEVLYSTTKGSKAVRFYKQLQYGPKYEIYDWLETFALWLQAEWELVKIDINCHIQGDVVLECISLNDDMEREEMMFQVVFNTAFIRSNILMFKRDEVDLLWDAKYLFPKEFRAEILFSEMDAAAASIVVADFSCFEKEGLPVEAFAKVHEIFSHVDWVENRADFAYNVLQHVSSSNVQEKSDTDSPPSTGIGFLLQETSPKYHQDKKHSEEEDKSKGSFSFAIKTHFAPSPNACPNTVDSEEKEKPRVSWNTILVPSQPCVMSQKTLEASQTTSPICNSMQDSSPLVLGHHDASQALGAKPLLHDRASSVSPKVTHQIVTFPIVLDPTLTVVSCRPKSIEVKSDSISPPTPVLPLSPRRSITFSALNVTPPLLLPCNHVLLSKPTHFSFIKESESSLQDRDKSSLVNPQPAPKTSLSGTTSIISLSTTSSFKDLEFASPIISTPPSPYQSPPLKTPVSGRIDVSFSIPSPQTSTVTSSMTLSPSTPPPPSTPAPPPSPFLKEKSTITAEPFPTPPLPPYSRQSISSAPSSPSLSPPSCTAPMPPPLPPTNLMQLLRLPPTTLMPSPPPLPPLKEKSTIKT